MEIELNNNTELEIENSQTKFLDTALGKAIDTGIDLGLRALLPNYIEDEIIELKDNLFDYGLKDGITKSVQSVIETGKSAIGLIKGDFSSVSEIKSAVKTENLVDSVSDLLDDILDKIDDSGKINSTVISLIQSGKDSILSTVQNKLDTVIEKQVQGVENLDEYIENWKEDYNNKDFDSMEKEYKKIQNQIKNLVPIETTLSSARTIETLHNLIKNNEEKFDLTTEEIELAEKLNIA